MRMTIVIPVTFGLIFVLFVIYSVGMHIFGESSRLKKDARLRAIEEARNKEQARRQLAAVDNALRKQTRMEARSERIAQVRAIPTAMLAKIGFRRKESPWVPLRDKKKPPLMPQGK
jgi:hypothetical protein